MCQTPSEPYISDSYTGFTLTSGRTHTSAARCSASTRACPSVSSGMTSARPAMSAQRPAAGLAPAGCAASLPLPCDGRRRAGLARRPAYPLPSPAPAQYSVSPPAPDVLLRGRPAQSAPAAAAAMAGVRLLPACSFLPGRCAPDHLGHSQTSSLHHSIWCFSDLYEQIPLIQSGACPVHFNLCLATGVNAKIFDRTPIYCFISLALTPEAPVAF